MLHVLAHSFPTRRSADLAVRDRKAGVEEAAALVAETHPGFPGADLVVEEAPHEIPVDGEAAGAENFLISRLEPEIVQRRGQQRKRRTPSGFVGRCGRRTRSEESSVWQEG